MADLVMKGYEHVPFNSAMIEVFKSIEQVTDIIFFADTDHCKLLGNKYAKSVLFHPVKVYNHSYWRIIHSDLYGAIQLVRILLFSSKYDMIVLLNRLPITLIIYNIINLFLQRRTMSILHGELESIVNFKNVHGLTKYYYQLFRIAYYFSHSKCTYIVLGEPIKKQLIYINWGKANLLSIDHPYDFSYANTMKISDKSCIIGIIGSGLKRKNSHFIYDLADSFYHLEDYDKSVSFTITGCVDDYLNGMSNSYVNFYPKKTYVSLEEYEREISKLRYSLIFFDNYTNIALASGSFFDCIKYEKPIIALKGNPFIDYYFDKLGNIGYRFDNINEMAKFINKLPNDSNYEEQIQTLRTSKKILSLDHIVARFKNIFD